MCIIYGVQETFLIINIENSCTASYIFFVETMIHCHSKVWVLVITVTLYN